jgi:hypothetical protein
MKPPSTAVSVSGPFDQQRQHQPIPTDFSSDGKYIVFQQNDPKTTGDLQVVALDEDGRELFYMTGNGPTAIMAVPVELGANFVAGTPQSLFEGTYFIGNAGRTYDVFPDGKRFLMIKTGTTSASLSALSQLVFVNNWFDELRRLAPAK